MKNVVQVTSGLGNQMFQYAFGLAVGAEFDTSWFDGPIGPTSVPREYELSKFRCEVSVIAHDRVMKLVRRPKLLRALGIRPRLETLREPTPSVFHPEYLRRTGTNFVGYFQCERYFLPLRERLLSEFRMRNPPARLVDMASDIRARSAVSLHVRRGDYVQLADTVGLCGLDYYRAAMRLMRERVRRPVFYVFSDDIGWTREAFTGEADCVFVDEPWDSALCDMALMAACSHHIIANSTYSWWGAWLNPNPGKVVVAPARWLATGERTDIVPEGWTRL